MSTIDNQTFLKSLIENLKKPIASQWRVQSYGKTKAFANVMSYIDARQCMEVLDQYAVYGWNREHYTIDGKIYCRVEINMPDGSVQRRSDCGTESNTEKEKGQSSDSFKRACVNFGIGRFLYDLPVLRIETDVIKINGQGANYPKLLDKNKQEIKDLDTYCNALCPEAKVNSPTKPLLSDAQLATAIARIKNGEKGVFYKASLAVQLTEDQFNQLKTA